MLGVAFLASLGLRHYGEYRETSREPKNNRYGRAHRGWVKKRYFRPSDAKARFLKKAAIVCANAQQEIEPDDKLTPFKTPPYTLLCRVFFCAACPVRLACRK